MKQPSGIELVMATAGGGKIDESRTAARVRFRRIAAIGVAVVMVAALFAFVDPAELWRGLAARPVEILSIAAATSLIQFGLSAWKWRAVLTRLDPAASIPFRHCYFYTAASAVAAQFMTAYAASVMVRGAAGRMGLGTNFSRAATTAAYEQLFDVVTFVWAGAVVVAAVALGASAEFGLQALGAGILLIGLLPFVFPMKPLAWAGTMRVMRWPWLVRLGAILTDAARAGLDEPSLVAKLMLASIMRYLAIGARSVAIALLLVPSFDFASASESFALVQLSQLAAITPGNIGVTEWSWAGAGSLFGIPVSYLATLALTLRIAGMVSSWLVAGLAAASLSLAGAAAVRT